jgi:hypothetical protein
LLQTWRRLLAGAMPLRSVILHDAVLPRVRRAVLKSHRRVGSRTKAAAKPEIRWVLKRAGVGIGARPLWGCGLNALCLLECRRG